MCASNRLPADADAAGFEDHTLRTTGLGKSEQNEEILSLFILLQDVWKFLLSELSMTLQMKFLN